MKNTQFLTLAIFSLFLFFTSCGSDGGSSESSENSDPKTESAYLNLPAITVNAPNADGNVNTVGLRTDVNDKLKPSINAISDASLDQSIKNQIANIKAVLQSEIYYNAKDFDAIKPVLDGVTHDVNFHGKGEYNFSKKNDGTKILRFVGQLDQKFSIAWKESNGEKYITSFWNGGSVKSKLVAYQGEDGYLIKYVQRFRHSGITAPNEDKTKEEETFKQINRGYIKYNKTDHTIEIRIKNRQYTTAGDSIGTFDKEFKHSYTDDTKTTPTGGHPADGMDDRNKEDDMRLYKHDE